MYLETSEVYMALKTGLLDGPTPIIDSVISLASVLNTTDYFKKGRTIELLGLAGKSRELILELVERGGR